MKPIPTPIPQAVLDKLDLGLLIESYRRGDNRAGELLLARYQRYLNKWLRLLTTGRWDRRDNEIRHFLQMLGSLDVEQTAQILVQRLRAYDEDDLLQELRLSLIEGAVRHQSPTAQYRFILKRRMIRLTRDPLVYDRRKHLTLDNADREVRPADIDEAWVQGLTCGPGFDQLSERDRRVVQLHYWYGWSYERVAEELDCSVPTVERTVRRVKKTLKSDR